MGRLEAWVLIETGEKIAEELKNKKINWRELKRITGKLIHFLRALAYVDRETRKLIEG